MTDFELSNTGNVRLKDVYEHRFDSDSGDTLPPLALVWRAQGIQFEVTDPIPSQWHCVDSLKAMGMVSVDLRIPLSETTPDLPQDI